MLGIGTIVSLFTAVLATQAILLSRCAARASCCSRSALGAGHAKRAITFDFMGASKWFFSMSGVILLDRRARDRRQGPELRHRLRVGHADHRAARPAPATVDQVRTRARRRRGSATPKIQTVDNKDLGKQRRPDLDRHAEAGRASTRSTRRSTSASGSRTSPTSSRSARRSAQSVANSALIAIIASLLVISIYIALRFEWKYAVPVLIALMHDILITGGRLRPASAGR